MMARRVDPIHVYLGDAELLAAIGAMAERDGRSIAAVDRAALEAGLGDIEVLVCGVAPRIDWSGARRLRLLQFLGSGVDSLWPARGLAEGVRIANARGIHLPEMAEHAIAMILAFARDLPRVFEQRARRAWRPFASEAAAGKTVAVVGLGEVGRAVAQRCAALGMHVVGVRAGGGAAPHVEEVFGPEGLDRVLPRADYVVVTVPLTERTRGMIDARALAMLRPHAVLVHMSRGGVVDEAALVTALRDGKVRGAALDVFESEPLSASSALWDLPNVIVTPHQAGVVHGYVERAFAVALENVARLERGEPVRTPVDRARGY
jgi:phosphoglycerate dehydrogenase-like enzyme